MGSCGAPLGIYWPGDVLLTYWGHTSPSCVPADTAVVVLPGGVRRSLRLERTATRWRSADVALARVARAAYAPNRRHSKRVRQLYFRGSTREDKTPAAVADECFRPNRTAECRDGVYSLGIRQTVRRVLGNHPMLNFSTSKSHTYMADLGHFEWCLTAPGMGFGVRIVDYVAAACLPVVVRPGPPGRLLLPLEPDLNYDEFAVTVAFHELPLLPDILKRMDDAQIHAKREALARVHRHFLWDEGYGTAYEAVRDALLRRADRVTTLAPRV